MQHDDAYPLASIWLGLVAGWHSASDFDSCWPPMGQCKYLDSTCPGTYLFILYIPSFYSEAEYCKRR